jgi:tetratricopeptide (TPR) repeat protein
MSDLSHASLLILPPRRPREGWRQALWLALLLAPLLAVVISVPVFPADPPEERAPEPPPAGAVDEVQFSPAAPDEAVPTANLIKLENRPKPAAPAKNYHVPIDNARHLRRHQDYVAAQRMLVTLLEEELPPEFKRAALFELALVAQDEKQLPRAQQILAQYVTLFPQDPTVPEVLLRQGLIYRQMGAQQMALAKFYAVMNSALSLKLDQFDYYKRLVLQSQTEIADTYYLQGKYSEAADFFNRILKQDSPDLNRAQVYFKQIRCLFGLGRHAEVVAQCDKFFAKHPEATELPELRFLCSSSLRQLGRSSEALGQVLKLLESQQDTARTNPENWIYWQQRAGNEIANQLYLEGDYMNALEVYLHLAPLDPSPRWQLPVQYQIGLIYERLRQPEKAANTFTAILSAEKLLAPDEIALRTVIDMARWRKDHINWQNRAELAVQSLHLAPPPPSRSVPAPVADPSISAPKPN